MLEERRLGYRRQRGSRVPDSWLNFKWTLSNCRVRTSSWGIMAAELSLSKLPFRLLKNKWKMSKKIKCARSWLRFTPYKYIKTVTAVQRSDPVSSCIHSWCEGGTYWGLSWLCLWLLMGGSAALVLNSRPFLRVSRICSVSVNTHKQHCELIPSRTPTTWNQSDFVMAKNSWF